MPSVDEEYLFNQLQALIPAKACCFPSALVLFNVCDMVAFKATMSTELTLFYFFLKKALLLFLFVKNMSRIRKHVIPPSFSKSRMPNTYHSLS